MTTALGLLAVVALILANGYFVAYEFAFVAARRRHFEELAGRGDRRAARALDVTGRLSFVLSGAQLGITATSLLVGFIAEPTLGRALAPLLELLGLPRAAVAEVAFTTAFLLATTAQMVLGELAPKNLAIAKPEPLALALARSTWLFTRLAGPLIRLFDSSANWLLRRVGIEPVQALEGGASPEELGIIVEESGREGALTPSQTALLSRALEFGALNAADAMVPRPQVVWTTVDASCEDLRRLALDSGHSRFPVVGEGLDDVRGIVQAKDVLRIPPQERERTPVRSLAGPPLAIPESASLGPLLVDMREAHSQLAVVVDEYGGTAGIVTLEDLVEELVGSIRDEYDPEEPGVLALPDGTWVVPGSLRVDEAGREIGLELPSGDYDTVGGLIMERLERVPQAGDSVQVPGARLTVETMRGLAVGKLHVRPLASPGGEAGSAR
ncbi:MAG TPA: hemolysin family protein [Egibacteraceae bacterium]|nr:hemolysin family protein [Egibacteraceae bacterium]